ncbi:group III truncated hemoglobin [Ruegeria faecimaris]|uniref:Truncated hemoglobin YjbI n=1 Tax=Ruegeria faecimaris TaxID=686389 RepID=A0A521DNH3_9RHOB|nr:Truncated hemoglobin YjbI [Ruegeria faecimaris]
MPKRTDTGRDLPFADYVHHFYSVERFAVVVDGWVKIDPRAFPLDVDHTIHAIIGIDNTYYSTQIVRRIVKVDPMTRTMPIRPHMFDITADEIATLVNQFYARIRVHPDLGPVFDRAIEDWPEHEEKIAAFWRGAILREAGYSGNPMQVHLANSEILPEHFRLWLDLFEDTAKKALKPATAEAFSHLASRIGKGLSFGIENFRREADTPPVLS